MSHHTDQSCRMTRRQFGFLLAAGTGLLCTGSLLGREPVFPAAEKWPFTLASIPELTASEEKTAELIARFQRGEIPQTVLLRYERYVSSTETALLVKRLSAAGLIPLCRSEYLPDLPSAGTFRKYAPTILAEESNGSVRGVILLEPDRGNWVCYTVPGTAASEQPRQTVRLDFARRLDAVLKA